MDDEIFTTRLTIAGLTGEECQMHAQIMFDIATGRNHGVPHAVMTQRVRALEADIQRKALRDIPSKKTQDWITFFHDLNDISIREAYSQPWRTPRHLAIAMLGNCVLFLPFDDLYKSDRGNGK